MTNAIDAILRSNALRYQPMMVNDIFKPYNCSIPFFRTLTEYERRFHPGLPAGDHPDRKFPWLVEPGLQSIEVYEAILTQTLAQDRPVPRLRVYICESGVVQRRSACSIPAGGLLRDRGLDDPRRRETRDVCFTLLSYGEQLEVARWLHEHGGVSVAPCPFAATPLGLLVLARPAPDPRKRACWWLGFDEGEEDWSQFPRSWPPEGVVHMGCDGVLAWALPGEDGRPRRGRSYGDGQRVRVRWEMTGR
ncbi:hypothetical protein CRV24_002037 [Beauveria bassiana]|nr:hypothetical protein CRV24_002037 [Beauveria bassiana]KAH8717397.1 hypothetical protein HC256_002084 [Beauveria bassiana]